MSELFRNKFRSDSARAQWWDYRNNGAYFITICTKYREYYFGDIVNGKMVLSELGEIAKLEWINTIELRRDMNLEMGEFVIMPNHFHGIIIIGENEFNSKTDMNTSKCRDATHGRDAMHGVPADNQQNKYGPQSKNIASIIRGFKSAVTTYARKQSIQFGWQSRFHDRIIRDSDEFDRISEYIVNNPEKWYFNKFYDGL